MSAPYRIEKSKPKALPKLELNEEQKQTDANEGFKEYLSRLLKMIPGEIVGLYMIGSGFIPPGTKPIALLTWSVFCLILLVILRLKGTADPLAGKPSQPLPVTISAVAFVIWLYWLGGPFEPYNIHVGWVSSLLVLGWSFVIPIFYKGE